MKYLEIPMHLPDYREGDYEPKLYEIGRASCRERV